jgi:hypothetical protein
MFSAIVVFYITYLSLVFRVTRTLFNQVVMVFDIVCDFATLERSIFTQ